MAFTQSTTERGSAGAPVTLELPEPVPLRRMLGPGVVAVGIGMAAGELILWPYLTALAGFGLLWLALATLLVQFVINMEIERYTLATGQTVVAGLARWWKGWGIFICLAGAFQYMWPGWATSASTVLTLALGGGNVTWITIGALVLIGIVLTASPVVYGTVEKIEWVKVGLTLVFLVVLVFAVISWRTWQQAGSAVVTGFGRLPGEVSFALMLSAIGAAGAGGVHNLVLSNWIRDKRYGMGAHVPRLVSPITGTEEAGGGGGGDHFAFPQDEANLARWTVWWRRANVEHFVTFFLVCLVTIGVMSMLAFQTIFGRDDIDSSPAFLQLQSELLAGELGTWVQILFYSVAVVSLYATALGLLDIIGRLTSDFLRRNYLTDSSRWTESRLYVAAVWAEIAIGSIILLSGATQPLALLVISTCAASIVTLFYSILIVRLNTRDLPAAIRLRGARLVGMVVAICFYGFFAVGLLVTQIQQL
jgi:hypothetical protein